MAAIDIDKVRIIVVGDSGVGKSSLVHLLCHDQPIQNPSWTVGCTVDVKLHEYREGTSLQKTYFVELWDIGGSQGHRNTRSVFYTPAHGTIYLAIIRQQQNIDSFTCRHSPSSRPNQPQIRTEPQEVAGRIAGEREQYVEKNVNHEPESRTR